MELLNSLALGPRQAPSRVMFGPHVTNLGSDERTFTPRHTAYYARRAAGGCGIVVTEGASVHDSDWPYERAPLASRCAAGWAQIAEACHLHSCVVIASLDHAGGQGSSAYSQLPLWAPSRVPEVNSRETPKWMEAVDIEDVIAGFASATQLAIGAGCDGVEINAGQHSRRPSSGVCGRTAAITCRAKSNLSMPHASSRWFVKPDMNWRTRLCCPALISTPSHPAPIASWVAEAKPATTSSMSTASIHFGVSRLLTSGTLDGAHNGSWL